MDALVRLLHSYEQWLQCALVRLFVTPQIHVAELHGGFGLAALLNSGVSPLSYLYVDDSSPVNKARLMWIARDQPFNAEFIEADAVKSSMCDILSSSGSSHLSSHYDVVFSFKFLHKSPAASLASLRNYLAGVAALLKPGGHFIGTTFDPSALWYKITKREREAQGTSTSTSTGSGTGSGTGTGSGSGSGGSGGGSGGSGGGREKHGCSYHGACFRLDFPRLHRPTEFVPFDPQLKFRLQLGSADSHGHLLCLQTWLTEAKQAGLDLVNMHNCLDFITQCNALNPPNMNNEQRELMSLFTTFIFVKQHANDKNQSSSSSMQP